MSQNPARKLQRQAAREVDHVHRMPISKRQAELYTALSQDIASAQDRLNAFVAGVLAARNITRASNVGLETKGKHPVLAYRLVPLGVAAQQQPVAPPPAKGKP